MNAVGRPHLKVTVAAMAWLVVGLAGCGGSTPSPSAPVVLPTVEATNGAPEPAFAWDLDGNGEIFKDESSRTSSGRIN